MKLLLLQLLAGVALLTLSCQNQIKKEPSEPDNGVREISFYTPDSIKIFGDLHIVDKKANTILLFHQGGSNARGEYVSIIPKLIEEGLNVLAIDQRVGGQIYGNYNRTIANIPTNSFDNGGDTYCDIYDNLESALDFIIASDLSGKKILWGSSYSASLAIQLAHSRQNDVDGVLAFSPASGGPMQACLPDPYFESLSVPLLILRPPNEMENENTQAQLESAKKLNHQTYVPTYGVHGSSMLVRSRVKNDVQDTWDVVLSFISNIGT